MVTPPLFFYLNEQRGSESFLSGLMCPGIKRRGTGKVFLLRYSADFIFRTMLPDGERHFRKKGL